jgi:hypothetical protein
MVSMVWAAGAQGATVTRSLAPSGTDEFVRFSALDGEVNDVTVRISDDKNVVTITDRATPLSPVQIPKQDGVELPGQDGVLCPLVTPHTARCTFDPGPAVAPGFTAVLMTTGGGGARVRDLPGGEAVGIGVTTGPGNDDVAIRDHGSYVHDGGGVNHFVLGRTSDVILVPGANFLDVHNGFTDSVACAQSAQNWQPFDPPIVDNQVWNTITADPQDRISGCGSSVDQG